MNTNLLEEKLKKELPNLWYIGLFNYRYWKSGDFIPGEEWSWFETLDKDIKDSSISCEEKRKALKLLWSNIKEFLRKGYKPISYYPEKPETYWWWHPELWGKAIDPLEVLKEICP
jgi:hypothetical protein